MDVMSQLKDTMAIERITMAEMGRRTGKSLQNVKNILAGSARVETCEKFAEAMGYEIVLVKKGESGKDDLAERLERLEAKIDEIAEKSGASPLEVKKTRKK